MTRIIKNKVVVPKDYVITGDEQSYAALSRTKTTTHKVEVPNISPFDFVYDNGYTYTAIREKVNIEGSGMLINPIDITYKITFNINFSFESLNFFRFRLRPNIDVRISGNTDYLGKPNYITPRLQVTINFNKITDLTGGGYHLNTSTITIDFDQIEDFHYASKENGYSIVYNPNTNEIYDDTENGTLPWGEVQTAALEASENGVMTTSMDDEPTPAADIQLPSVDSHPSILESLKGARINKAVVPQDYARLIYSTKVTRQYSLSVNHDLTTLDLTEFPFYDMVGEINCKYTDEGYIDISTSSTNINFKYIYSTYILSSGISNKYRLIRIIEKPNLSLINSGNSSIPGIYYIISIQIDGDENLYQEMINLGRLGAGEKVTTGTQEFAFILDTKTKEFYNDTENGTELWSSKYQSISSVLPSLPK